MQLCFVLPPPEHSISPKTVKLPLARIAKTVRPRGIPIRYTVLSPLYGSQRRRYTPFVSSLTTAMPICFASSYVSIRCFGIFSILQLSMHLILIINEKLMYAGSALPHKHSRQALRACVGRFLVFCQRYHHSFSPSGIHFRACSERIRPIDCYIVAFCTVWAGLIHGDERLDHWRPFMPVTSDPVPGKYHCPLYV